MTDTETPTPPDNPEDADDVDALPDDEPIAGMLFNPFGGITTPRVPPPKPGRRSPEEEVFYLMRVCRMAEMIVKGYSYRAIARDLGVAFTTVLRMKPDVEAMNPSRGYFKNYLA